MGLMCSRQASGWTSLIYIIFLVPFLVIGRHSSYGNHLFEMIYSGETVLGKQYGALLLDQKPQAQGLLRLPIDNIIKQVFGGLLLVAPFYCVIEA